LADLWEIKGLLVKKRKYVSLQIPAPAFAREPASRRAERAGGVERVDESIARFSPFQKQNPSAGDFQTRPMSRLAASFPRKRESSGEGRFGRQVWIPAFAGMTSPAIRSNRIAL
jgi:hypothetical protein